VSSDVVDNLTSTSKTKPLSAYQGKVLNDKIASQSGAIEIVNNLTSTATDKALSAYQGKLLNDNKLAKSDIVNNLTSTAANLPLSAAQGKALSDRLKTLEDQEISIEQEKLTWTPGTVNGYGEIESVITAIAYKDGKRVDYSLSVNAISNGSGNIYITLPLAPKGSYYVPISYHVNSGTEYKMTYGTVSTNNQGSTIKIEKLGVNSDHGLSMSGFYYTE
jgi:hypothetical protein